MTMRRNCDIYLSLKEAKDAFERKFIKEHPDFDIGNEHWLLTLKLEMIDWLYAEASTSEILDN